MLNHMPSFSWKTSKFAAGAFVASGAGGSLCFTVAGGVGLNMFQCFRVSNRLIARWGAGAQHRATPEAKLYGHRCCAERHADRSWVRTLLSV